MANSLKTVDLSTDPPSQETPLAFGCSIIDPRCATDPQAVADEYQNRRTRRSSVDALIDSPGYGAITMQELWQIANAASDVTAAARGHMLDGPYYGMPEQEAFEILGVANRDLIAVMVYTVNLREVAQ